jgi:hypothetical protein
MRRAAAVLDGERRGWRSYVLALAAALSLLLALSGCTSHHGPLTNLGDVDQYPAARWNPNLAQNQVAQNAGIYAMPNQHLILIHVQIPDTNLTSLGPGAVHGAVGVWWVALDDRVLGDAGTLLWVPSCGRFKTIDTGGEYDLVGDYLAGPARANLSRYPLAFNPDDGSVSVALSPEDEISIPRSDASSASLPPQSQSCAT